jgi:phage terminase large subunit-like protein
LDDLKKVDCRWYFNADKANRVCQFIESLTLDNGEPFRLSDWQIWIVASLVGWMDEVGTRKYIEALVLVPKGNGKSPMAAALGCWFAFLDGRRKAEVCCGAMSLAQALEVFTPAKNFVESAQRAFNRLGVTAQKKSIFSRDGSKFTPVISKGRHGARNYLAILDELHQAISADLYGTLKTGCNKTPNSLMLTISTAGVASTENPCYQLQVKAQKALDGSLPDDRFFAAIYCADDSVEWSSDEALQMANPNLGISNDAEKLRLAIESALRNPGEQNNTKAMHLNIWSTAASAWLNMAWFNACEDASLKIEDFKDCICWLALDASSTLDLTSIAILFKKEIDGKDHYYAFSRNYLPEAQIKKPENTHYQRWQKQGYLTATGGNAIDISFLEQELIGLVQTFNVECLCADSAHGGYAAAQKAQMETGVEHVLVPQRAMSISPAMRAVESAIADGRFHVAPNPVLTWCFSNVVTHEGPNSIYRMPDKERPENKIDSAMATFFAMSRAMLIPAPAKTITYRGLRSV